MGRNHRPVAGCEIRDAVGWPAAAVEPRYSGRAAHPSVLLGAVVSHSIELVARAYRASQRIALIDRGTAHSYADLLAR